MRKAIEAEDYRIKGYHKSKTTDNKGDYIKIEYFLNYDESTEEYSGLKVQEIRTVERSATLGIPFKVTVDISWFEEDGTTIIITKQLVKHINTFDGMAMNQVSRTRLVETGQGYLLGEIGLANTQEFGTDVISERGAYIAGTRQPLIDAINASTRTYMTQAIKDQLTAILDIPYY